MGSYLPILSAERDGVKGRPLVLRLSFIGALKVMYWLAKE